MLHGATLLLAATLTLGQSDGEQVFQEWSKLVLGGTWTTTIDGANVTHAYRLILNDKFLELTQKGGDVNFVGICGVDPKTRQFTWWIFQDDGGTEVDVMTREADKVWKMEGSGHGPNGENRWKCRVTEVDPNTIEVEILEWVRDGIRQPNATQTWKRTIPPNP